MNELLFIGNLGTGEIIIIAIIVLLLFGGKKIPELMKGIGKGVKNFKDGLNMALGIGPSLMSVGFLGLLLAEYTPVFDIIGYIFVPFAMLMGFGGEAIMMGKACAISLAEMFLPANIVAGASPMAQYVTAIVCVSEILFFSASIPCVMGTDIDISLKDILIIWVERIILSLILAALVVRFLFPVLGVAF